jgi:hypothetical protein
VAVSTAELIAEKMKALPADKQAEVLDFIEFLRAQYAERRPLRSLRGLWKDLNGDITEEDLAEARREMWANFPREDI